MLFSYTTLWAVLKVWFNLSILKVYLYIKTLLLQVNQKDLQEKKNICLEEKSWWKSIIMKKNQ